MKCQRLLQPFVDATTAAAIAAETIATTANSIDFANDVIKRIWPALRIRNILCAIVILIKFLLKIVRNKTECEKSIKYLSLFLCFALYSSSLFNSELF